MKKYLNKINYKLYFTVFAITALLIGCEDSNLRDGIREITFKPTANRTLITVDDVVTFTDSSLNVASRLWTFEGGSIATSDQAVVDVTYSTDGIFATEFEKTGTDGTTESNIFNIEVFPHVTSSFNASVNAARIGSDIEFTNTSENTVSAFEEAEEDDFFFWEFEGGAPATSTAENPVVTYPDVGVYDVKLTVYRSAPEDGAITVKSDFITIVDVDVISPVSIELMDVGSKILLTYPTSLVDIDDSKFTLTVDGSEATFSFGIDGTDPNSYLLELDTPIVDGQTVVLSYSGGDFANTGELLAPIVDFGVIVKGVVNFFEKGDFEGVTTGQYDVNNGFLGSGAGSISVDFVDGAGIDGSRASVWTASAAAVSGNKRTIFGDKDGADIQLITPVESDKTYIVRAMVKYTGTEPVQIGLSMVNFPWNGNVQNCALTVGTLVEGDFVEIEGEFTTSGAIGPDAYALPNVTVGDGASVITIDNFRVYEK